MVCYMSWYGLYYSISKENILYSNKTNFFLYLNLCLVLQKNGFISLVKKNFKNLQILKIYYVGNAMYSKKIFKKIFKKE